MGHRAVWLPDVLADAGLTVVTVSGWEKRGRDVDGWRAVIPHHTATPPSWSDQQVDRLLRDGRPPSPKEPKGLPGPLCQLGLDRLGRLRLIAAGKGNHNGGGTFGNQAIGIEAYNDGVGEPWPAVQVDSFERACAAILEHLDHPTSRCMAHKETDPTRKRDPFGIDMTRFRLRVETLRNPLPPAPAADYDEDDLLMPAARDDNDARCALIRGWFWQYLGRGPNDVAERDVHLFRFASDGADACLAGITDTEEHLTYRRSHEG